MAIHTEFGSGAPASTPVTLGQHYTDTLNGQAYLAVGTSSAADWVLVTDSSTLGTISTQDANNVAITGGSISGITDLAIADGGTGASTATAAFDALAPTTTAGDIIYHNGTDNVRLPIGTAGQRLSVNAGATAIEWQTVSGSGGTELKGLTFTSDTGSTADSDPGAGLFKWNNATQASATFLYFDNATLDAVTVSTFWASLGAAGFIYLQQADDATKWQLWKWTSTPTDGTGYYKFPVTLQASGGSIADDKTVYCDFKAGSGAAGGTAGKHAMWIAAGSMTPSATGGCAPLATIASAANQPDIQTLNFDATTQEYGQFSVRMPKSWNEGTVTFVPVVSHAATTTNFGMVFDLQAVSVSNDDGIAVAFGTAQTSTITGGTTNDIYIGPESSAITIAGTPAAEDMVFFRISRVTGNGSDTMAIDARLHGITLFITTDAETDA